MKFSFMYFLLMTAQRKNSLLAFYSLNTGLPLGALGPLAALRSIVVFFVGASCIPSFAETKLFDMDEIHDVSTLAVEVIKDWHVVEGNPPTRQKCVTIRVGEAWEGQEYRVPLRMIVPVDRKAKGFHLTTDYEEPEVLKNDARISSLDAALIAGGVGLVQTTIGGEPRDFREGYPDVLLRHSILIMPSNTGDGPQLSCVQLLRPMLRTTISKRARLPHLADPSMAPRQRSHSSVMNESQHFTQRSEQSLIHQYAYAIERHGTPWKRKINASLKRWTRARFVSSAKKNSTRDSLVEPLGPITTTRPWKPGTVGMTSVNSHWKWQTISS